MRRTDLAPERGERTIGQKRIAMKQQLMKQMLCIVALLGSGFIGCSDEDFGIIDSGDFGGDFGGDAEVAAEPYDLTVSVSGRVRDHTYAPLSDVTITLSTGEVATTDSNGEYNLKHVEREFEGGSFGLLVTPSKEEYTFQPKNIRVAYLSSSHIWNEDFVGVKLSELDTLQTLAPALEGNISAEMEAYFRKILGLSDWHLLTEEHLRAITRIRGASIESFPSTFTDLTGIEYMTIG